MTRYSLKVPQFQILIGATDITEAVVGYSFRHPLAEPSTPLIWTGTIEMFPVRSGLARSFFDDEINPQRWLSGLQPIDVYFNGTWWQRFRIKPSGYRFNQDNGQAEIEIADIIGILDSYQPSADAPDFKTGQDNRWNDLAVKLIHKQASLMGITVSVQTPPYGIGGVYKVPRSIGGSYIKEAQKMAGERGIWMWSNREVINWVEYPQAAQNIVWSKSRKQLLNFTRQQGLDPVKEKIIVSATHEDVDVCKDIFPRTTYSYVSANIAANILGIATQQSYRQLSSVTVRDRIITDDYIYNFTTHVTGNPAIGLFGGQVDNFGRVSVTIPEVKSFKIAKINGYDWLLKYTKKGASFDINWQSFAGLLDQTDITTYENIPLDSQNPSKILKRIITKSEPWAKFPDGLQYFGSNEWLTVDVENQRRITERTTTTYKYIEIFRDDIVLATGQKLYEISEVTELKEQVYFYKRKEGGFNPYTSVTPMLVPLELSVTKYKKQCQGRWKERKIVQQNKGQSDKSYGYLFGVVDTEDEVYSIPEITYRPAPYPVFQKPLLATVQTGCAGVSPFVNSNEFLNASTLTAKAELEAYARRIGRIKWQRYYSREIASGYSSVLGYQPFQGVFAGNGAYIRDRFGVSLNQDGDTWQFVEDCIGNKTGAIAEIQPPLLPYPPILSSTLNIGAISDLSFMQGMAIATITFNGSGGQSPYTYSSTALPTGLTLSSSGVLSGTPTAIVTIFVTVTVTDNLSATDSTTFNIAVIATPVPASIISETTVYQILVDDVSTISFLGGILIPAASNIYCDDLSGSRFLNIAFPNPFAMPINSNDLSSSSFLVNTTLVDDISSTSFDIPP